MWFGSSVDRALHQYCKDMGSNPVQAQIFFFGLLFKLLKLKAHCEDHEFHSCLSAVLIYDFHIFIFMNNVFGGMFALITHDK